jgi:hypothetical protein
VVPASITTVEFGGRQYTANRSLVLELPSAIAPEESILVINASHPGARQLKAKATRRIEYKRYFARNRYDSILTGSQRRKLQGVN